MKTPVKLILNRKDKKKVYSVKNVIVQNTIGLLINGNGNVQIVDSELLYAAEQC